MTTPSNHMWHGNNIPYHQVCEQTKDTLKVNRLSNVRTTGAKDIVIANFKWI